MHGLFLHQFLHFCSENCVFCKNWRLFGPVIIMIGSGRIRSKCFIKSENSTVLPFVKISVFIHKFPECISSRKSRKLFTSRGTWVRIPPPAPEQTDGQGPSVCSAEKREGIRTHAWFTRSGAGGESWAIPRSNHTIRQRTVYVRCLELPDRQKSYYMSENHQTRLIIG